MEVVPQRESHDVVFPVASFPPYIYAAIFIYHHGLPGYSAYSLPFAVVYDRRLPYFISQDNVTRKKYVYEKYVECWFKTLYNAFKLCVMYDVCFLSTLWILPKRNDNFCNTSIFI